MTRISGAAMSSRSVWLLVCISASSCERASLAPRLHRVPVPGSTISASSPRPMCGPSFLAIASGEPALFDRHRSGEAARVLEHRQRGLRVVPYTAHLKTESGARADHERRIAEEDAERVHHRRVLEAEQSLAP